MLRVCARWGGSHGYAGASLLRQKPANTGPQVHILLWLKGQCQGIFDFYFFHESVPPALEYPIRTILNFFENSRRYAQLKLHHRCCWHRRQTFFLEIWHRCCWYRWQIATGCCRCRWHGCKFATGVNDTSSIGGKFAAVVVDTGGKFATGVVDTGGKFATSVFDTCKYLREFSKNSKWP